MENNNPIPPQPQPNQPQPPQPNPAPIPAQPQTPVNPINTTVGSSGSNKLVIFFIIGILIIAALVGGIYYMLSKQQKQVVDNTIGQVSQPIISNAPKPEELFNALDEDLNSINAETPTDFTSVDQDLQNL